MNYSTAIFLISDQARAVMVTYEDHDNADRTMYKTLDPNIKVDDFVVTQTDTRHHMTVCKVAEVDVEVDFDNSKEVKWIVGTVNTADFNNLERQESDAIERVKSAEKRRRRAELREAMLADMKPDDLKSLPFYDAAKDEDSDNDDLDE